MGKSNYAVKAAYLECIDLILDILDRGLYPESMNFGPFSKFIDNYCKMNSVDINVDQRWFIYTLLEKLRPHIR